MRRGGVGVRVGVERDLLAVALDRELGLGVAGEAVLVRHAGAVEDAAHLVRLVAVDADRNLVRRALPEMAFDDLAVHELDLPVALGAGPDHVAALIVDLGSPCGRMLCAEWQEVQTAVTVRPFLNSPSPWIESA